MTVWHDYKTEPPNKNGNYLVYTMHEDEDCSHIYMVEIKYKMDRDKLLWGYVREIPHTCGCNGIEGKITHWAYPPEAPHDPME